MTNYNYRNITFRSTDLNHIPEDMDASYEILLPYEDKIREWIGESDKNRLNFVNEPITVLNQFMEKRDMEKLVQTLKTVKLPLDVSKFLTSFSVPVLKSGVPTDPIISPSIDYTEGWDEVASVTVEDLNYMISRLLEKVEYIPYVYKANDYEISMNMGQFLVTGGNGVSIYTTFPVLAGSYSDTDGSQVDLSGAEVVIELRLDKVEVDPNIQDKDKESKEYKYYLSFADSDLIKSVHIYLPDDVSKPLLMGYAEVDMGRRIPTIMAKFARVFPIYSVTVKAGASNNNSYLLPTHCEFCCANTTKVEESCFSTLIKTVNQEGEWETSLDSIPKMSKMALIISNKIFMDQIMVKTLVKSFSQYNADISENNFITKNNSTCIEMESNTKIELPIDNCPDINLSALTIAIDQNEEFVIQTHLSTTLAHFYNIEGTYYSRFKLKIENAVMDGKNVQKITLVEQGEPIVDLDCDWGWAAYLMLALMIPGGILGAITAAILASIQLVITKMLNNFDVDDYLDVNELLDGKLVWEFTNIADLVEVHPLACLQIGFSTIKKQVDPLNIEDLNL